MLLSGEKENLHGKADTHDGYQGLFKKLGCDADQDRTVCAVNQHPLRHPTVAHTDGSLPTYLASGHQKLWSLARRRWLTGTEKWASMGWPTTQSLADILERPMADTLTCSAHERIGNGMHLFNCLLVLTAVLTSVERVDTVPMAIQAQVFDSACLKKTRL